MSLLPELTPSEIQDHRKDICKACDYRKGDICSVCGCFITLKVKFANSSCPQNKWEQYVSKDINS